MVQKKKTTKPVETKIEVKAPKSGQKMSMTKKILVAAMLVINVAIWYEVGAFLFGFSTETGWGGVQKPTMMADTKVVATINGENLTLGDVREFARNVPQLSELPFDMIYPQILETMVNAKVIQTAAEKSGVEKDPNVAKALKMARDQVLSQAYLTRQLDAQMTPEKLQEMYMNEMKNFERQEEVRARHILVSSKKEAEDIIVQLKAGVDFAMLANAKSLDTENKGGSLGYFTKNMMIPEFGNAVFAMKKGQLSAPIKTPFGWHVVLVEDRRLAAPPAFEDVQDQLKQIYAERNVRNVVAEERQKAHVNVLVPTLRQ